MWTHYHRATLLAVRPMSKSVNSVAVIFAMQVYSSCLLQGYLTKRFLSTKVIDFLPFPFVAFWLFVVWTVKINCLTYKTTCRIAFFVFWVLFGEVGEELKPKGDNLWLISLNCLFVFWFFVCLFLFIFAFRFLCLLFFVFCFVFLFLFRCLELSLLYYQ